MTRTILYGAPRSTMDFYTGPAGELTVDDSNKDLRLHDGVTPGGIRFMQVANSDQRYQLRSVELDGLTSFEPQQRGFLVRLGPSDYRLRELTVNENQLTIQFGNAYEGNPLIGIASVIQTEHTWNGQHQFNEIVDFTAGINADVIGSLVGPVIGNLTGNVTGNVAGNAAGNHTGSLTGDVDVRGQTLQLDDGQIGVAKIDSLLDFVLLYGFPAGGVIMWSGSEASIPDGWFLCNGLNGTPNLRNRFIVGAGTGGAYGVGATGGSDLVTPILTVDNSASHTHAVSGSTATHTTGYTVTPTMKAVDAGSSEGAMVRDIAVADPGHFHTYSTVSDSAGIHTHAASSSTLDNRPQYFALCYIMKG